MIRYTDNISCLRPVLCCAAVCRAEEGSDEQELQEGEYQQALGESHMLLLLPLVCLCCQHCCSLYAVVMGRPYDSTAAVLLLCVCLPQLLPSQPTKGPQDHQQQHQQQTTRRRSCCSCCRQPSTTRSCCRSWCAWQSSTGLNRCALTRGGYSMGGSSRDMHGVQGNIPHPSVCVCWWADVVGALAVAFP